MNPLISDDVLCSCNIVKNVTHSFRFKFLNSFLMDTEPPVHTWCTTEDGEEVTVRFAWTIKRFSERPEKNTEVNEIYFFTLLFSLCLSES